MYIINISKQIKIYKIPYNTFYFNLIIYFILFWSLMEYTIINFKFMNWIGLKQLQMDFFPNS